MLEAVAEILRLRGSEGWLVGGSVRDRILGRYSPDLDVAVADDATAVAQAVAAALRAPWFAMSERHPTCRVLGRDSYVDVAAVRGDILSDLGQRDFTVNAMAVPVASAVHGDALGDGSLLDPFGGAAHLAEGRLVAVSERIFAADPLRLLRAPRFCHTLGLRLDRDLARAIQGQAAELTRVAAERVVSEMCLTLAAGHAADAVRLWDELRLLTAVLPELGSAGALRGVDAPETAGEAWPGHSSLLERLDDLLERPTEWFPETDGVLAARLAEPVDGAVTRPVALRLAGVITGLSAADVRAVGRRLKLSSAMVSLLSAVARAPRVTRVVTPAAGEETDARGPLLPAGAVVTRAAVLFLWDAAPWEPEAIMVAAAAAGGRDLAPEALRGLMCLHLRRAAGEMPTVPLNGETLMRELGLKAGPLLGRALREARLAWEAGEARTADEALAAARRVATER